MAGHTGELGEQAHRAAVATGSLDIVPAMDDTVPRTAAELPAAAPDNGAAGLARRLTARFATLVRELGKFGAVGGVAFAVDLMAFNVLLRSGGETLIAKTGATVLATTVAFAGHRGWTWRHRARRGLAREYSLFFLLNAIGLGIGLACLAVSHYGLGTLWPALRSPLADNVSGLLVGSVLGSLFRFWSYRRFVFPSAVGSPATVVVAALSPGQPANPDAPTIAG